MNTKFSNFCRKAFCDCLLAAGVSVLILFGQAAAAENFSTSGPGIELRNALEEAARDAKLSDEIDPGYELLSIAEAAQQQNLPQIAANAATAFADLVKRVTAKALRIGAPATVDTLDQFVDLRFMARSANLPLPQAALDEAMANLFPVVSSMLQQKFAAAQSWAEKLNFAAELGELQASATQIMKDDVAKDLAEAFDQKIAALEALAGEETAELEREGLLDELAAIRKSRDDRIIDANANNINIIAALMRGESERETRVGSTSGAVGVPEDLGAGIGSCVENGFTEKQDPARLRILQSECTSSGRRPAQTRCSTANLAFLCYDGEPGGEKMTFVYRGTPEEFYFQRKCSPEKVVMPDQIPPSGATFRAPGAVFGFTCAPTTTE